MSTPQGSSPEPSPQPEELVDVLGQTTFTVVAHLSRIAAAHELSLTQMRMLGILRDRTARIVHLAQALGVDKSSASGLVDRAVARGLLSRERSAQDRRAIEVRLTAAGQELVDAGMAEFRTALRPLTDRLDADTGRRLTQDLGRLLGPE